MSFDPFMLLVKLLGGTWLNEVRQEDVRMLAALTDLGQHLPQDTGGLLELAVEYQRLFGFNLPPYESIFVDPSALLGAPAASLVQATYQRAGWQPPANSRTAASDHLGLQMLALADLWASAGLPSAAEAYHAGSGSPPALRSQDTRELGSRLESRLHAEAALALWQEHLALWAPAFLLTLRRLQPHPFYQALGESTLELLLAYLPERSSLSERGPAPQELFPELPPAPRYKANLPEADRDLERAEAEEIEAQNSPEQTGPGFKSLLRRLLAPREAGLYITRQDLAGLGLALDLPVGAGERYRMLQSLFELADQYDMLDQLLARLIGMLSDAGQDYAALARQFPAWSPYAQAWRSRLDASRQLLRQGLE
jgi:TorA maturation chaperone TorD